MIKKDSLALTFFLVVKYVLPPKTVLFTGAVGDDEIAEQLKRCNRREGLDQVYQVERGGKTGACAVIITGHSRYIIFIIFFQICIFYIEAMFFHLSGSLVATLRVADKFDKSHLLSSEVAPLVESVRFFYMDGYFLTHGLESALYLSIKSATAGKVNSFSKQESSS